MTMVSHICRACLVPLNEQTQDVPIFQPYKTFNLQSMICATMQISPKYNDKLGEKLCRICAEKVIICFKFRSMFIESDKILRQIKLNSPVQTNLDLIEMKSKEDLPSLTTLLLDGDSQINDGIIGETTDFGSDYINDDDIKNSIVTTIERALLFGEFDSDANQLNISNKDLRWKCKICSFAFHKRSELCEHNRHHKKNFQTCILDRADTNDGHENYTKLQLFKPEITGGRWNCNICNLSFKTRKLLRAHKSEHPENIQRWQCCGEIFRTRKILYDHRRATSHCQRITFKYVCDICGKEFALKCGIRNHMRIHTRSSIYRSINDDPIRVNNPIFRCDQCNRRFKLKYQLEIHITQHKSDRAFTCETCGKSYFVSYRLTKHIKRAHLNYNRPVQTNLDLIEMKSKKDLPNLPTLLLEADSQINDGITGETTDFSSDYINDDDIKNSIVTTIERALLFGEFDSDANQSNANNKDLRWKCEICFFAFHKRSELREHIRHHKTDLISKDKPDNVLKQRRNNFRQHCREFQNGSCKQQEFENQTNIVDRTDTNNGHLNGTKLLLFKPEITEGRWNCNICDLSFKTRKLLHAHKSEHQGNVQQKSRWQLCGESFRTRKILYDHQRVTFNSQQIPADASKYVCEICGKEFAQKCGIRNHMRIHTRSSIYRSINDDPIRVNNPIFRCDQCNRRFKLKYQLKIHSAQHKSDRAFTCETCGKSYFVSSRLTKHIKKAHLKEKLFKCTICSEEFTQKDNLMYHMFTHKESGLFPCHRCGKRFAQIYLLNRHLENCEILTN